MADLPRNYRAFPKTWRKSSDAVIFLPTYNESGNVEKMAQRIRAQGLRADLVFLDDASPDGTGAILDTLAKGDLNLLIIHRPGKLGIGGAHLDGIRWAYDQGYKTLITMDSDFTHPPEQIRLLLKASESASVVVGSRHLEGSSIEDWGLFRRFLTRLGHILTVTFLKMPYDATGAFRVYRLDQIPREFFGLVTTNGYAFFFLSLYLLHRNSFSIVEIPIILKSRHEGKSKMSLKEIWRGLRVLFLTYRDSMIRPRKFLFHPQLQKPESVAPSPVLAFGACSEHSVDSP